MVQDVLINDILQLSPNEIKNTRVRFNIAYGGQTPAYEEYAIDEQNAIRGNYWNNKAYKKGQIVIGFITLPEPDKYLLIHIGEIKNNIKADNTCYYKYSPILKYEKYFGRLVVKYHNSTQQLSRCANNIFNQLVVSEILPTKYTGFDFPGYKNVHLTYKQLKAIVTGNHPSYRNALAKQKAIYVQTDRATGMLYIGKASAKDGMLLDRWTAYAKNGHGGNKELKKIIETKGFDYIKENFTYAIIENFNEDVSDEYVYERESYWKEVLDTREHGYNDN